MKAGVIEVRAIGPIIELRIVGPASDVAVEAARVELSNLLARGEQRRYGFLVDLREASLPRLGEPRRFLDLLVHDGIRSRSAAVAVVTSGRATSTALDALLRLAPLPVPMAAFPHAMAAEAWLRGRVPPLASRR